MKLYKDYTKETYSFLVNDTTFQRELVLKMTVARKSKQSITKRGKQWSM